MQEEARVSSELVLQLNTVIMIIYLMCSPHFSKKCLHCQHCGEIKYLSLFTCFVEPISILLHKVKLKSDFDCLLLLFYLARFIWYSLSQFLLSLSCLVTKVKVLHTSPLQRVRNNQALRQSVCWPHIPISSCNQAGRCSTRGLG